MIEATTTVQNLGNLIIPVLVLLTVIAICVTVFSVMTWNIEPWTRKYLKPHKQLRTDRYRVRIWKLRSKYPEAFAEPSPFKEQNLDVVADIVHDIEHKVDGNGDGQT